MTEEWYNTSFRLVTSEGNGRYAISMGNGALQFQWKCPIYQTVSMVLGFCCIITLYILICFIPYLLYLLNFWLKKQQSMLVITSSRELQCITFKWPQKAKQKFDHVAQRWKKKIKKSPSKLGNPEVKIEGCTNEISQSNYKNVCSLNCLLYGNDSQTLFKIKFNYMEKHIPGKYKQNKKRITIL